MYFFLSVHTFCPGHQPCQRLHYNNFYCFCINQKSHKTNQELAIVKCGEATKHKRCVFRLSALISHNVVVRWTRVFKNFCFIYPRSAFPLLLLLFLCQIIAVPAYKFISDGPHSPLILLLWKNSPTPPSPPTHTLVSGNRRSSCCCRWSTFLAADSAGTHTVPSLLRPSLFETSLFFAFL